MESRGASVSPSRIASARHRGRPVVHCTASIGPTRRARSSNGQQTLAGEYFTSDEIFVEEQEKIFRRRWLCVGHVSLLPSTGSYVLFEFGPESAIVLRDGSGSVGALHNICRHRGSRLNAEPRGELERAIRCPRHAWTHELDGALRAAPNMTDVAGFSPATRGLEPCQLGEWEGLLLNCVGGVPDALEQALKPLAERPGRWRMADLRSVQQAVHTVEANWKLLFHNYSECYH